MSFRVCLFGLLVATTSVACGDDQECIEGKQERCACPKGMEGVQVCSASGAFGACLCDGQPIGDGGLLPMSDGSSTDTTSSPEHSPRIIKLSANSTSLDENDTLIISAVVTDPDGIEDLIGGVLEDPKTNASYGSFHTSAQEGSYEISLSMAEIDAVDAMDAARGEVKLERVLRARFYDVAGNSATGQVEVSFQCSTALHVFCGGKCVEHESDEQNCGACGEVCADSFGLCVIGTCAAHVRGYGTCDALCAKKGWVCLTARDQHGSAVSCAETEDYDAFGMCACVADTSGTSCVSGPENTVAKCSDGCSNDDDTYIDCDDYDCCGVVNCPVGTSCYGQ